MGKEGIWRGNAKSFPYNTGASAEEGGAGPVLQLHVADVHEPVKFSGVRGRDEIALIERQNHGASHAALSPFDPPSSETVRTFSYHFVESYWVA